MAILDDVIGVFSPGWKAARLRSRVVIQAYEAVKTTRTHKARRENRTADQLSQYGAVSLREQARYLDNNHDLVIGVFDKLEERVVGKNGIIVEPHPVLRNGAIARDLAAEIRTRWSEWSVSPEVTGQFTRPMLERLMLRTWLRDGEVFAQMVSGRINSLTPSAGVHFWLEALEPDFIPMTSDESNRLNQGVFVDDWGRPEKYLVYKSRPVSGRQMETKEVDAERMLHLKFVRRLHQMRGTSLLSGVLIRLSALKEYEDSELTAARIAAALGMYIRKGDGQSYEADGNGSKDKERELTIQPGIIYDDLKPGEEIGMVKSDRPNPNLETFRNTNISGVTVVFRAGEQEQTPPEGFESSGSETVLGTEVKYDTPITRTITSANIDRLRFTFGVQALVETTSKGDRNPSEVRLLVQIQRNGGWVTEKDITIKGKTTSQYLASVVVGNLPPRPFNIRMRRMTPDSTTDQLQNKTLWSSYTEIIDVKQCYRNTALVGVQVDSEQFGSQQVSRNYHLRGRILQVPSNYNPQTRQYSGIWDGTFKPAYSNNMAWCLWDMLTHPRYGMGKRLGAADVDKWALYVIGQHCDQSVPDGFGGTEPRITCNAYLTTQRKAWDVLSDFCSAMRCMPVWNGQTLTFVQDRPSDKVWTYNRSNVVMPDDGAPFRYSFSALKDRHNAVEVNWIDPNNGWETATELVEDTQAIARYGRNVTKMDAFGCTSRGQAHRAGLWLIKTELLETQTVDFSVGAEGLRHVPGDVIEICDDDYAGIRTGGRVLAVNSQTRTLTLDREITLPSSGTTLISLVDGQGSPVSVEVQSVTDGVKVKVSRVPDGVAEYSVWGLKLPTLRQRLFRCVSIRENDDGTYAITAVQHVPEKEAIVDNGAHFDGDQSGTVNGVTPPAVQHLTAEVTADSGEYQVLARWDTPKVVKGVSFLLRLTVAADDGRERLVSTARTTETTYRFTQLALGNYRLTVRAVNAWGQQGDPASVSFRIAAPAAPSRIELTPGYFQITATPHLAVYDPTVQFEFWFSEKRITDIRQVETTARYLGTGLYWIAASINIKPGHDYYFYIRSVNTVGKSAFVEAVGRASDDAEGYLDFFKGKITESHLGKELLEKVDLTEDNASRLDEFSKEWKDANDKWNAMWGVKIEQTKDGKHYVAGIGLSMEDTEEGKLSQFLVAANRIAFIDPANGNETPMFVAQGNQIFMNDVFLKRLTAPTITSGGNPPAFSLTPDGKLTAKNADISGSVNANSGTLNNVTINENCQIKGKLSANQIEGDIVKTVSKSFPRTSTYASGTITVRISDDQKFDRQVMIPPVLFRGGKHENFNSNNQQSYWYSTCRLRVTRNGQEIFNQSTTDAQGVFSSVIDMPAGQGTLTLTFTVSSSGANNWTPTTSISDLLVVVMKKSTAGISIS
ncbi:phage portal protein [Escherichia coli]|nr:phage portal protein [Escherichia coli]MCB4602255.1 phage portal protein [Escherichia coli]